QPNPFTFFPGQKTVLVKDTNWVIIDGDTVISRYFEIGELFWGEEIIEKFGIFSFDLESPSRYCTGAIINGQQYGTIVSVEDENIEHSIPGKFILENNYPNPFNPTTTIRFSIPRSRQGNSYSNVKLVVYDPLGREVVTLVDEQKSAGTYDVTFNAKGLSSGVYYYSLISGTKIITKPMVLIK
ncbi:T9SS type A sorting domain-containing protein, partial [Melioribacter sp. Ez-97]|uniref:T9SS type A sorting domain-containing protein n=1 Tax=Melioribacter sp. Ez-97 TaxID=3423434 RepID=UPI003EDB5490